MATRPQIEGPIHAVPVDDEVTTLREELNELRSKFDELKSAYQKDRENVGGFIHGLRALVGGSGAAPSSQQSSSAPMPHNRDAWNAWKQQVPPACAKIIDALLVQPLTQTQIVSFCKMRQSTASQMLGILKRNGLIEMDGRLNRLKRL